MTGHPARRDLLPSDQAADRQPPAPERGARLGAHVARHRHLRAQHQPPQRGHRLPQVKVTQPGRRRLPDATAEDAAVGALRVRRSVRGCVSGCVSVRVHAWTK